MLWGAAACDIVLQCVAVRYKVSVLRCVCVMWSGIGLCWMRCVLWCAAACCSVLQCVAVCCRVLQSVLQSEFFAVCVCDVAWFRVALDGVRVVRCCSVLQCVAVCMSVFQSRCVAVCVCGVEGVSGCVG